jgi:hypothetical protein
MQDPEDLGTKAVPAGPETPIPDSVPSGAFDPVAHIYRTAWAINHANVHRPGTDPSVDRRDDVSTVERQPFAEDGTRLIRKWRPQPAAGDGTADESTPSPG